MKKLFLYVFFLATQLSALLLPIHSVRKTRVPYLIRLQKHSRRLQSLHAFQKNKALLYILQQIDNYWKSLKSSEAIFMKIAWNNTWIKNYTLQITNLPIKMPAIKKSIQIFAHSQSFFSLVCKVHNCHVGDHQILSFFLMSARGPVGRGSSKLKKWYLRMSNFDLTFFKVYIYVAWY